MKRWCWKSLQNEHFKSYFELKQQNKKAPCAVLFPSSGASEARRAHTATVCGALNSVIDGMMSVTNDCVPSAWLQSSTMRVTALPLMMGLQP